MKVTVDIDLTLAQAAEWFAGLDDDTQAQFFVEVARVAAKWEGGLADMRQWSLIGKHLRECSCSTDDARSMVRSIYFAMEPRP